MTEDITSKSPTPSRSERPVSAFRRFLSLTSVLVVTVLLASAWLVFPYFIEGRSVLEDVGDQVSTERNSQARTLGQILTRLAEGPGEADVDVLFATPTYFNRTSSKRVAAQYDAGNYYVFIINEGLHVGDLSQTLPKAELVVNGATYQAADLEGPLDTDHHRTTFVRFNRLDAAGEPIVTSATDEVKLIISNAWDEADSPREAVWDWPISYPDEVSVLNSPILIMALSAGLLSATLTPCLLQLIVVYMATLTGLSAEQIGQSGSAPLEVRRKMMLIAVTFVLGFMVFYTLAGAAIGYAGKSAQLLFSEYSQTVAVGSGILVIAMGIWMGIKARAPLVCRIPAPKMVSSLDKGGFFRSALLAAGFSLGCMVCFSGAIMATLFIYVGALGSATTGALILFVFSLGVAIPFLAAAFFLSRTMTVMNWISRYSPQLGFVSMIVIVAFGLVLITDNFHTVSDLIYPLLGLS